MLCHMRKIIVQRATVSLETGQRIEIVGIAPLERCRFLSLTGVTAVERETVQSLLGCI